MIVLARVALVLMMVALIVIVAVLAGLALFGVGWLVVAIFRNVTA